MCTKQRSTSTDFNSSISEVAKLSLYHNLGLRNNTLLVKDKDFTPTAQ